MTEMDNCSFCENAAKFNCVDCGKQLCEEHTTVMKVSGVNKILRRCPECLEAYQKNQKDIRKERRKYYQKSYPFLRYSMIAMAISIPLYFVLRFFEVI